MNPFQYGCVVCGENFCPRPELERQLREFAESGQNLVIQGARRMGKTSPGQRSVLRAMAVRGGSQLYSHEFATLAGLSTSSIRRIVDRLVADRILFLRKGSYRFSNPFFREWLARQG